MAYEEELMAALAALPSDVRATVDAMGPLAGVMAGTLFNLGRAPFAVRLAEDAAEARAYASAACFHGDISEQQWRLLLEHIESRRESRRVQLCR